MHENFQYASPLADGAEAGVSRWGMRIASLHSYPVKGGRRLDHDEAGVEPHGLAGDRRWMIVDDRGVGITQREVPRLAAGEDPVPITRFRPNLVVAGAPPWAEDEWLGRRLRVGAVTFRAAEACNRCVVTTVDQDTGERTGQPLKMLGQRRRFPDGLLFGTGLIPDVTPGSTGIIRVGDEVTLLS
jgi:uncharacterized protein YcbX